MCPVSRVREAPKPDRTEHVNRHEQEEGDAQGSLPQETGKSKPLWLRKVPLTFLFWGPRKMGS